MPKPRLKRCAHLLRSFCQALSFGQDLAISSGASLGEEGGWDIYVTLPSLGTLGMAW